MTIIETNELQYKVELILQDTSMKPIKVLCAEQGISKYVFDYNIKKYHKEAELALFKARKYAQGTYSKHTPEEEKQILDGVQAQLHRSVPLSKVVQELGLQESYIRRLAKKHNVEFSYPKERSLGYTKKERRALLEQYNTAIKQGVSSTEALSEAGVRAETLSKWFKKEKIERVTRLEVIHENAASLLATVNKRIAQGEYLTIIARDLKTTQGTLRVLSEQHDIPLNAKPNLNPVERKAVLYEAQKLLKENKPLKEVTATLGWTDETLQRWSKLYDIPLISVYSRIELTKEEKLCKITEFNELVRQGELRREAAKQVGASDILLRKWCREVDVDWVVGTPRYTQEEQESMLATILPKVATGTPLFEACKEYNVKPKTVVKWLKTRDIRLEDYLLQANLFKGAHIYKALLQGQTLECICKGLPGITTTAGRELLTLFIAAQLSTKERKDI